MSSPIWHLINGKFQFFKYNNSGNLSESNNGASESITEKVKKYPYCYIPGNDYANCRDLTKSEMSLKQMINHPTCLIDN